MITVYTDGSCHTQHCIGAWASIVFLNDKKYIISGIEKETTHNRMEIIAVIKALEFIKQHNVLELPVQIISDSQYVIGLVDRQPKFLKSNFKTKAGDDIRNIDLVKKLLQFINTTSITFTKIKAHQKQTRIINYNIEVDKICRSLVRESVCFIEN